MSRGKEGRQDGGMGADRAAAAAAVPSGSQPTQRLHPEMPGPHDEQVLPEVVALLRVRPLRWIHCLRFEGRPGFPDLFIAGLGGALFAECKPSRHIQLEAAQLAWKWALIAGGQHWVLWGREDLADGTVERELDRLAG
jgi:hypothetical protein